MLFDPSESADRPPPRLATPAGPMTLAATLVLSFVPQVFPGGDLKLPPRPPAAVEQQQVRPVAEIERFRRDLLDLHGPAIKVEAKLEEMGRSYPGIEQLILQVARTARANEMRHLMPAARRFGRISGSTKVADELLFQLLARRLGGATRPVVETMAALKGPDAKAALKQCVRAKHAGVRRYAVQALAPLCTQEDVAFALQLSREQSLDLRLRGVDLLQAMGGDLATARLVELLAKDPALAAAACRALVGVGAPAVPALEARVAAPAVDRSFVYSAFALAEIHRAAVADGLPAQLLEPLVKRLKSPEALTRVLAAVPLADLVYRAKSGGGDGGVDGSVAQLDRELVEALLLVVEPGQFVPNLDMLRNPAEQRLLRHTGRVLSSSEPLSWREWWETNRDTFLGVRSELQVAPENAGTAVVTLRRPGSVVRVLGEHMAALDAEPGAVEVILAAEEMADLAQKLERAGFGSTVQTSVDSVLPRVRSLDVRVDGGRSSVAVTEAEHLAFDSMVEAIDRVVDAQVWQLYRLVTDEPDRVAFWRAERAWLAANADPRARARRFVDRVVRGWAGWDEGLRARAIGYLAAQPERGELLGEAGGDAILGALRGLPKLTTYDLQLLEVASTAPGDRVWRDCVELAITADGGGRAAVKQVFGVLGPDAVISALEDARALVRRAAVEEVVSARDLRAAPRLVAMLADEDLSVRRAAVYACGQLRIAAAGRPLVDVIIDESTEPQLRRETLRALGRVGGGLAFPVLQKAMQAPGKADKEAALRGLGELRDPRSAHLLSEFVVVGYGKELGEMARFNLQRLGGLLAGPALRRQIPQMRDERVRADLVLMLGSYQAADNLPDLMDLLRQPRYAGEAAPLLEGATGVDLVNVPDRITAIEAWWRDHKDEPQWRWYLDALRRAGVPHRLQEDWLRPGADQQAVPELCRLLVELELPRLWVLTSAMLRSVAGEDYGVVTPQTPPEIRDGLAARYRARADAERAAGGR